MFFLKEKKVESNFTKMEILLSKLILVISLVCSINLVSGVENATELRVNQTTNVAATQKQVNLITINTTEHHHRKPNSTAKGIKIRKADTKLNPGGNHNVSLTFMKYQEHRSPESTQDVKMDYNKHKSSVSRYKETEWLSTMPKREKSYFKRSWKHGNRNHGHHHHKKHKHSEERISESASEDESEENAAEEEDEVSEKDYSSAEWSRSESNIPEEIKENPMAAISYLLFLDEMKYGEPLSKDGIVGMSQWHKNQPVKLLIHGYYPFAWRSSNHFLEGPLKIIFAYLKVSSKANLILCNWTATAAVIPLDFQTGASSLTQVAHEVANFLINLKGAGRIKEWSDVHLIGFSLGAHIAGIVGSRIQRFYGGSKLGRITGLDPANAGFDTVDGSIPQDASGMLDRSDADFVDIIHCNQGSYANYKFGSTIIAGHADFYPNGGSSQPNCRTNPNRLCSHEQCMDLFAGSLNNANSKSCQCSSWEMFLMWRCDCTKQPLVLMGDRCPTTARGLYFLKF